MASDDELSGKKKGAATPIDSDDELINNFLSNAEQYAADATGDGGISFGDTVGKADDAVDYEDISDDELPPEEEPEEREGGGSPRGDDDDAMDLDMENGGDLLAGMGGDEDDLFGDDLFGDGEDFGGAVGGAVGTVAGDLPDVEGVDLTAGTAAGAAGTEDMDFELEQALFGDGFSDPLDSAMMDLDVSLAQQQQNLLMMNTIEAKEARARQVFPDFEPHKVLSFSSMFKPKPGMLQIGPAKIPKTCIPTKAAIEMAPDDSSIFNKPEHTGKKAPAIPKGPRVIPIPPPVEEDTEAKDSEKEEQEDEEFTFFDAELELAVDDWDSKIEAASQTPPSSPPTNTEDELGEYDDIISPATKRRRLGTDAKTLLLRFTASTDMDWLNDDRIFEGDLSELAKVTLDMNDNHLLLDVRQPSDVKKTRRIGGEFKRRVNRDLTQRYNISNDEAYDLLKENHQNKVRSTIGQLNIEHSLPALRLQSPYYKTKLSTKEARSFHRPTIHFHIDQEIRFDKMKYRKKKSYRGKDVQEVLATTKDLSLSDGSNFILLEYSEEYPPVLSNFGMGSRLINYYRRKGPDDESRPKLEVGETHVLMSQDRSPFWNFGTVDAGEIVPTLYNKMVRAPVFKQTPKNTDFLVVRSTYDNASRYYLRAIPYIYVVGQLFPVTEVPGPHSRKVTTAAKNRLKMICYRVCKRKESHAIAVKDISTHFPENNDMQNRQKMKEFMSYQKHTGLWEMKPGEALTDEAQIRAMIKPEDLCLLEAMQVGVRNLEDAGYSKDIDEDDGKDAMSLEQQLTPWTSSKNFIHATQGKAMLQLHGEGDPSGRGEAFSFVRTSMKGGFKDIGESIDEKMDKQRLKELGGHSYNVARQQKQYEEAIQRIWRAQHKSLSSTEEPTDVDIDDAQRDEDDGGAGGGFDDTRTPGTPWMDDETTSQFSRMSAKSQRQKILKITRKVRNRTTGKLEEEVQIVEDPKVIRQYLARRRELDAEKTQVESLVPTGNADEDAHAKRRLMSELQRLQRNKERREARERQSGKRPANTGSDAMSPDAMSPGSPMYMGGSMSSNGGGGGIGKQATTRKCANCGQAGHIRTNKKLCPKLNGEWEKLGMSPPAMPGTPNGP